MEELKGKRLKKQLVNMLGPEFIVLEEEWKHRGKYIQQITILHPNDSMPGFRRRAAVFSDIESQSNSTCALLGLNKYMRSWIPDMSTIRLRVETLKGVELLERELSSLNWFLGTTGNTTISGKELMVALYDYEIRKGELRKLAPYFGLNLNIQETMLLLRGEVPISEASDLLLSPMVWAQQIYPPVRFPSY